MMNLKKFQSVVKSVARQTQTNSILSTEDVEQELWLHLYKQKDYLENEVTYIENKNKNKIMENKNLTAEEKEIRLHSEDFLSNNAKELNADVYAILKRRSSDLVRFFARRKDTSDYSACEDMSVVNSEKDSYSEAESRFVKPQMDNPESSTNYNELVSLIAQFKSEYGTKEETKVIDEMMNPSPELEEFFEQYCQKVPRFKNSKFIPSVVIQNFLGISNNSVFKMMEGLKKHLTVNGYKIA